MTRDCAFYSASIGFVLVIMADGKVWWWEGLISVCLYFVYVAFMTVNEKVMKWVEMKTSSNKIKDKEVEVLPYMVVNEEANKIKSIVPGMFTDEEAGKTRGKGEKEGREGGDEGEGKQGDEEEKEEEEEEDPSPFALPDTAAEYPLWLLCLPWYATFTVTVPDCGKAGKEGWYLVSFGMSVFWISAISYGMVDAAANVGCILDVPEVIMGTLVLAAGTSVPDALASIGVAKNGFGDMAVANAVGSNVFDIWLGLGLPWLVILPSRGGFEEVSTRMLWPSIFILAGVLAVYYISVALNSFKLVKQHGYMYLTVYALFVVYSIVGVWRLDIYELKKDATAAVAVAVNATNVTATR